MFIILTGKFISERKEFGDYQTPIEFAIKVCEYLKDNLRLSPQIIIEPTCGIGNFLESSYKTFNAQRYIGIEINQEYTIRAKERFSDDRVMIVNDDLFSFNLSKIIDDTTNPEILIVGNPPWVNNSTLSLLDSSNQPKKTNFKGMKGLDAITGSANFDICESMILKLISSFRHTNTSIALLCKTIVARNVFKEMKRLNISFNDAKILRIDAKKIFDVSVDSCLLYIKLTTHNTSRDYCEVFDFNKPKNIISKFGFKGGNFYSNLDNTDINFDGKSCFNWRQGVKHDCSKIMELSKKNGEYINGKGEVIDIEDDLIFPLVKSSHLKEYVFTESKKYVIVTQHKIKQDTSYIKTLAPKTWDYLNSNIELFRARKSSIYRNSPDFSMFGIGEYSYSKYKVGVSGFYKKPIFSLLSGDKPIMMDDTCYFISFNTYGNAYVAMLILNSNMLQRFLKSIAFVDAKRPYTKKVLERIDFGKLIDRIDYELICGVEVELELPHKVTKEMYNNFVATVKNKTVEQLSFII